MFRKHFGSELIDVQRFFTGREHAGWVQVAVGMLVSLVLAGPARAEQTITLHGAVQFSDEHTFNKTLLKFEELTKKYYGKPVNFVLHRNSELGLEKDYFAYMNQGLSVDYASSRHRTCLPLQNPPHL